MASERNVKAIRLDTGLKSSAAQEFETGLRSRIVGQSQAVRTIASLYQTFQAGFALTDRPIGVMLFLGPTGSGKTRVVEAAAEVLFGDPKAMIKIDCAEFQHSHEIAKLVGSPPGYLGHRETTPMLTQENLDKHHTERDPFTLVLLDEIEKASESLWQLMLGVLDKATITLGDNCQVDFSQTMIFMTSNQGAKEMGRLIKGSLGFAPAPGRGLQDDQLDQKIYDTALEAVKHRFSPEFINRIDNIVVFRSLKGDQLRQILDLELGILQRRVSEGQKAQFTFTLTSEAKEFLLEEGTDIAYGARHLKRAINRFLVSSLASLVSSGQVRTGDMIVVEFDCKDRKLTFSRQEFEPSAAQAARVMQANNNGGRIAA